MPTTPVRPNLFQGNLSEENLSFLQAIKADLPVYDEEDNYKASLLQKAMFLYPDVTSNKVLNWLLTSGLKSYVLNYPEKLSYIRSSIKAHKGISQEFKHISVSFGKSPESNNPVTKHPVVLKIRKEPYLMILKLVSKKSREMNKPVDVSVKEMTIQRIQHGISLELDSQIAYLMRKLLH